MTRLADTSKDRDTRPAARKAPSAFTRILKAAAKDRRGNVAIISALALPMVVGGVGFGVETGYWYHQQLRLQQAADAAAYAGGVDDRAGLTHDQIVASATAAAQQNGFDTASGTITVNTPPTSGSNQNDHSVEVLLTRNEQRFFTQVFSTSQVVSTARSVSTFVTASDACVLALDPIAPQAAEFQGNSTTTMTGCSVMANSLSSSAVYVQGSSQLTTPCVLTAGGVSNNGGLTETSCSSPMTNLPPVGDPLASLAEPAVTGNCRSSNGATLQAGRYCGGLTINNTKSLNAGVYIIDGGTLKLNANAIVSGTGVMFYLANNATVQINGNAQINVTAATSGTYSGILFFGSRSNAMATQTLNGTATSSMTGTIYFPTQEVDYLGNFTGANGCTHVISDKVYWSGNATVGVDCSAYGMSDISVAAPVKLAE
jgi:Flp pilus assembly protein TadG